MLRPLSSSANFEGIRKEAVHLLHCLRWADATALKRYYSLDPFAGMFQPTMDDAKYVIAREYGFASWQKLRAHLKSIA